MVYWQKFYFVLFICVFLYFQIYSVSIMESNSFVLQLLVIGSEHVGKTHLCFILSEINNQNFRFGQHKATTGTQTYLSNLIKLEFKLRQNIQIQYKIADTPGLSRYRMNLTKNIRVSDLVILVFSINDEQSFQYIEDQISNNHNLKEQHLKSHCQFFIVGNKIDLKQDVLSTKIRKYEQKINKMIQSKLTKVVGYWFGSLNTIQDRDKRIKQIYTVSKRGYCIREFSKPF